ncbi:ras association domain-containing protein 8 [Sitodiplosis mosellana]|uniref:ras association domain-containing protein 8 n=1 Tax=Sitodiplosis mosellana TaxID=263140 RepID=UPI002444EC10|nr:ras association domain-containing protein 8 [Sitodiplosis mosellana]XP_055302191.1 ras association domain-containing protein 8 [Sitodiplosis mosellana]XP_055302192.1 ras association domain-containing protein 8 [Sitodiplosis mosellana]XP_055302194.1 ras association domain-containing protein 8 [Sitodiplosis mosellana]XP_055302195.1 ras association domain-containing protein 8 [Sitodiplosis mosellana]XP_055302196.1 ras association domain-containing protein 8 [Sitodiplosis mosellana]
MELKVWVEGIQRIVCGVTETTTCQDVVFALAHATGKIGRFTLIERWRNNERLLAPNENPLKILMKWGEYSSDVQFILQRSDQTKKAVPDQAAKNPASSPPPVNESPKKAKSTFDQPMSIEKLATPPMEEQNSTRTAPSENIKTNEHRRSDLIGIVKGIPHATMQNLTKISPPLSPCSSTTGTSITTTSDFADIDYATPKPLQNIAKSPILQFNSADVRNSLDRKTSAFREMVNLNDARTQISHRNNNSTNSSMSENSNLDSTTESYKNGPPISSNGALLPPPYRNPPSPKTNSPLLHQYSSLLIHHQKTDSQSSNTTNSSSKLMDFTSNKTHFMKELSPSPTATMNAQSYGSNRQASPNIHINALSNLQAIVNSATSDKDLLNDNQFQNAQYRELLQLIHLQREKISHQQSDISKFDAEITFLESRERDQIQQLDAITREITKTDQLFRQSTEQLQTLQYVEEENKLVRQQEKTLKSEITLLRSKLANCETELLQCKNKIRLLMDDIQIEQTSLKYEGQRQQFEINLLHEVERIQNEIDMAVRSAESTSKISDSLKNEVTVIETAIAEKKRQLEKLINEMKEVNLQSLTVASTEEIRNLLEGSHRPGSTRRIMGSPRQLETAVPTSKNPHGVWV